MENSKITCAVQNLLCVNLPSVMIGTIGVPLLLPLTSIIVMTWNLTRKIWVSLYTIIIGAVNLNMPLDIYLFLKSIRMVLGTCTAL